MTHRARKRFGQNFLHDPGVIDRIIRAINPAHDQHLVEIGPGQGAITEHLLAAAGRLDAVELDRDLVTLLSNKYRNHPGFHLHSADALKFDFCQLATKGEKLRIIGNLPYNISTPLLFHLLENAQCLQDMHFMLQKEVVERMAAGPGSKTYGRLSVMLQAYCQVRMLFPIGPGAFQPAPKVESAFVRLVPHEQPPFAINDPDLFSKVVTQAFSQRRKTLRNTLKGLVATESIASCGMDPSTRAEQLSVEDFACLANTLACIRTSG
ncbi:16S rRNA (adenine(1518)-N(6)/adenine(1519)-N(6))-dimethyltransferase RsmA [Thiolapillus sp.]